jgi:hypothetical protein
MNDWCVTLNIPPPGNAIYTPIRRVIRCFARRLVSYPFFPHILSFYLACETHTNTALLHWSEYDDFALLYSFPNFHPLVQILADLLVQGN